MLLRINSNGQKNMVLQTEIARGWGLKWNTCLGSKIQKLLVEAMSQWLPQDTKMCLSHFIKIHVAKQDNFFNCAKNTEIVSLNETFWMWIHGANYCTFSWQKAQSLLRADLYESFFFSTWIQPFLKKRETMPLFSSKFFEHAHLKGIIFSDNTFYCYIAKSRFPRPLYISK